ncbi:MAG: GDP-mannose 4,6-dehydratase [Candidatus Eisenbacteria bacterium]|nr:GDP-mannose 4,6-dehydratase [Candidatus Eisenbacteria bacterium]
MRRSVLVTGALGFVGGHLCRELMRSGHEVFGCDLECATAKAGAAGAAFPTRACDVSDADALAALVSELRPSAVVHLAAQSSASRAFVQPRETFLANALGTQNLFEAVSNHSPETVVLVVSSGEIYGPQEPGGGPATEETPVVPVSPYALSKAVEDMLGLQYWKSHGIRSVRARPFNHTGPGQTDTFVLPSFAKQIALAEAGRCEPVIEVGNLEAVRDFLDVRDVVRAYLLLLERGRPGESYNICSGRPRSIRSLLDALVSMSRTRVTVRRVESRMRPSDIAYLVGDNSKLRGETGWEPAYRLEDSLQEILEQWRKSVRQPSGSRTSEEEAR